MQMEQATEDANKVDKAQTANKLQKTQMDQVTEDADGVDEIQIVDKPQKMQTEQVTEDADEINGIQIVDEPQKTWTKQEQTRHRQQISHKIRKWSGRDTNSRWAIENAV